MLNCSKYLLFCRECRKGNFELCQSSGLVDPPGHHPNAPPPPSSAPAPVSQERVSLLTLLSQLPATQKGSKQVVLPVNVRKKGLTILQIPAQEQKNVSTRDMWQHRLVMLNQAARKGFDELKSMADHISPFMPLPQRMCNVRLNHDMEDAAASMLAQTLKPFGDEFFPIRAKPNNSCFYASASRLLYGDQEHDMEMRVRLVTHMALNLDDYMNHDLLTAGHKFTKEHKISYGNMLAVFISLTFHEANATPQDLISKTPEEFRELLQGMVMDATHSDEWANIFAFQALANVTGHTVKSYYPSWEEEADGKFGVSVRDLNRLFKPIQPKEDDAEEDPLVIMWSALSSEANGLNHFVPVVR